MIIILTYNFAFIFVANGVANADININKLYELHNDERSKANLPNLTINSKLVESAHKKAQTMLELDCWSHYCPEGTSPWINFDDVGYDYVFAGENLAEGFSDNAKLMQAWMNSQSHRENILNSNFKEVGISYVVGRFQGKNNVMIVVVHFGTRNANQETQYSNTQGSSSLIDIKYPLDYSYYNYDNFEISGYIDSEYKVDFYIDGERVISSIPGTEYFSFNNPKSLDEGRHIIYSKIFDKSGNYIESSENIIVTIDKTSPLKSFEQLYVDTVLFENNEYLIELSSREDDVASITPLNLQSNNLIIDTNRLILPLNLLDGNNVTSLKIIDLAGNEQLVDVPTSYIVTQANNKIETNTDKYMIDNSNYGSIKDNINLGFTSYLAMLFGIDYIYTSITGADKNHRVRSRSKSHLNLVILILLIFVLVLTFGTGQLIN